MGIPFGYLPTRLASSSAHLPCFIPGVLGGKGFMVPFTPLGVGVPVFTELSVRIPRVVSVSKGTDLAYTAA